MTDPSTPDSALNPPDQVHSLREDVMALATGALFISLGLVLFRQVGLLTGGTAGLAFLAHYAVGQSFGFWFFCLNLPFYWLAWLRMGRDFTLKTFASVALISWLSGVLSGWINIASLNPLYAAVMGGCLVGCGLLILFRHKSSLGGVGILALYLQDKRGIPAGQFQMGVDCLIVLGALAVADLRRVGLSIVGAVVVNLVLATNHKPGRYRGMS